MYNRVYSISGLISMDMGNNINKLDISNLQQVDKLFNNLQDKKSKDDFLTALQKRNDKLYSENKLTSEVLDLQVWINSKRHEEDLPDKSELVTRSDGDFVQ